MAKGERPIRVLVIAQGAGDRARLRRLLSGREDITLIRGEGSPREVLQGRGPTGPDVTVVGLRPWSRPGEPGFANLGRAQGRRALAVVEPVDDETLLALIMRGASGYLTWDASRVEIYEAVRTVHWGGAPISPQVARVAADALRARLSREAIPWPALTPAEYEILRRVARGDSDQAMGEALQIEAHAMRCRVVAVLRKIGAKSRTEAPAAYAGYREAQLRRMDAWREAPPPPGGEAGVALPRQSSGTG